MPRFKLDNEKGATDALKKSGELTQDSNSVIVNVKGGSVMDAINAATKASAKQGKTPTEDPVKKTDTIVEELPAPVATVPVKQGEDTPVETKVENNGVKSAMAHNLVQITTTVEDITSNENKYKNSKNQVTISEDIKNFLGIIAPPLGLEISQILNNMLLPYFQNPELVQQLRKISAQRQREIAKKLEGENKALNITLKNKKP
ncbi:hypothetical protein FACS1894156_3210 [Bacteroidia bacterium]|nr:hypothetical protein FACS1894156_3210 [Bacteroidia bacterium]